MRETTIEDTVMVRAARAGWFCRRVAWRGRKDCPDVVFSKGGRTVWIEFKQKGKPARESQALEHEEMMNFGMEVHVCDDVKSALRVLWLD